MPNEIDMKIRLSKSLLSEARKAATPSPQGPASLNSSETTTVSDLLRKPIPIWVRIPIPLVYPRPHFPSLSISLCLSLAATFHSSACCDHLFPINCAMSPATLDFYCWPWSKRPSKQLAYILFSYFYPLIYPHCFCQFFVYSFGLSRVKCNAFAAVTQFVATSSCICIAVCKQFFNANLSCGFVAPLHIDVCVCGGRGKCLCDCNLVHDTRDLCYSIEYYAKCTRFFGVW